MSFIRLLVRERMRLADKRLPTYARGEEGSAGRFSTQVNIEIRSFDLTCPPAAVPADSR